MMLLPQTVQDYQRRNTGVTLTFQQRELKQMIGGDPVSFNPFTDHITYAPEVAEITEQVVVTGFLFEGDGFKVSGNLKPPVVMSSIVRVDGERQDESFEDDEGVTEAIYDAIGGRNYDAIDIV